jgi:hypothetical protein
MEAFEHVTKVWLEGQGYVVSGGVKFPVKILTKKASRIEHQTHGYEMDLVAAKKKELVLVSVKSFFGSKGFSLNFLLQERFLNNPDILKGILQEAQKRYGYKRSEIRFLLCVGRLHKHDREAILEHLQKITAIKIDLVDAETIGDGILRAAKSKTYINDPVIVTIKCLMEAGKLPTK